MADNNLVNMVIQAVLTSLDMQSPVETRHAAVLYLENIKSGDVRACATVSFQLVKLDSSDYTFAIRNHGFKMLQHLVRLRWEELTSEEKTQFAAMAIDIAFDVARPNEPFALMSQAATLVAEVARRELTIWDQLFSKLVSLSDQSSIHAKMVAMVLKCIPEEITVHNEDLEGDRRRQLLCSLTLKLPLIFNHLYMLLRLHSEAASNAKNQGDLTVATQHTTTVIAAVKAVCAYAEWAPIPHLRGNSLIEECGRLLQDSEYCLDACEFFKLISSRRRPSDETVSEFDSAMALVFDILMKVAKAFLDCSAAGINEKYVDFVECICESMVSLGCNNLQCIAGDEDRLSLYLQEMLGFFQHPKFELHFQSLPLWLYLFRESSSTLKSNEQADGSRRTSLNSGASSTSGLIDKEKKGMANKISDVFSGIILDVTFQRMLKKNPAVGPPLSNNLLELWNDDFASKGEFSQYRNRLLEIIRLIAAQWPIIVASKISQRVEGIIRLSSAGQSPPQDLLVILEGAQLAVDTIISAIFDGGAHETLLSAEQHQLRSILEGMLQQLLSVSWTEPAQIEILGRFLDAFGPFLKHVPEELGRVISKLFVLLKSLPIIARGQICDSKAASIHRVRLQICSSFVRIARAADRSILGYAEFIAGEMSVLQGEGRLERGEYSTLAETFLVMASVAGSEQQEVILKWLLDPLKNQWCQLEWQDLYLSNPMNLVHLLTRGLNTSENELMWLIFHTVTFFERAIKRSGNKNVLVSVSQESSVVNTNYTHPLASQLTWMLPPLLKLLRCIHSLWSKELFQAFPGEVQAALGMTYAEKTSLLGDLTLKSKGMAAGDGSQADSNRSQGMESRENEIQNWLKGVRDTGYNVLGLATGIGDHFYKCMDSDLLLVALFENLGEMAFRHIRQLIHSVIIPLVKNCHPLFWEAWLGKLLPHLLQHCDKALSDSWTSLVTNGRANVPDCCGVNSTLDLKTEVLEERLLRDLTRETCALLQALASPVANKSLPSTEQLGLHGRMESSPIFDAEKVASESLMGFLFRHHNAAIPALEICRKALSWPDSESVSKTVLFCGSVVVYSVSMNNFELQSIVAKDFFEAVLRGLTLESNALIHAHLVSLCREIFIHLSSKHDSPKEVLLSKLGVSPDSLSAFETALSKTSGVKEQRQLMKGLLLSAPGSQLKALTVQKNINVITNLSSRSLQRAGESRLEEGDRIGLAAINTTA